MKYHHHSLICMYIVLFMAIICIQGCIKLPGMCSSNIDCESSEYCNKTDGNCNGMGKCESKPDICPTLYDPVCGCDGNTYPNECTAAVNGVSVDHKGECKQASCWYNEMCGEGYYCYFRDCALETGICEPRPDACIDLWDPVCGCDGKTYSNACYAAAAGVSVDYEGECKPVSHDCFSNADCGSESYCQKETGNCNGSGECNPRPQVCPDVWDPVCGCDGKTYSNACCAAAAGVSVDYEGECKPVSQNCFSNGDCGSDEFCMKAMGDCNGLGNCEQRPEVCITLYDPVCGCNGQTYSNECVAAGHGVSVAYKGECKQ
jgi:hypothetical protein